MTNPTDKTVPQIPLASAVSATDETQVSDSKSLDDLNNVPVFAPPEVEGEVGRLGKYRILKQLGRGGMGAVYLAFDEKLQRQVALKVMLPNAAANVAAKDRFLREARAAAQISSDHVVAIYEADEIEHTPYIALQYLQGASLEEYLHKRGNLQYAHVIRIAKETAEGLAAAHQLGLIHRDIKPANLWLEAPKGRVKILDFGLARQQRDDVQLTQSGAIVGTPTYMSPEQARSKPLDARSDLFSVGCVMYRLLTGVVPFAGDNTMAVLMALGTEEPTPIRQMNPQVPVVLADLTHRLLAKNPDHRPKDALTLAALLKEIEAGKTPVMAFPTPDTTPLALNTTTANVWEGIEDAQSTADVTEQVVFPRENKPTTKKVRGSTRRKPWGVALVSIALGLVTLTATAGLVAKLRKNTTSSNDPSQTVSDLDRQTAELVFSLDGRVRINDDSTTIDATALPKGPFRITGIYLMQNKKLRDHHLANFRELKHLTALHLAHTMITDTGMTAFKDSKNIKELDLEGTAVTDVGLAYFKDCKNLLYLNISATKATDEGLASFKECKNLKSLFLNDLQITDAGLVHFSSCKALELLELESEEIGDEGVAHFRGCKQLTNLSLADTEISDVSVAVFKDAKKLMYVDLSGTEITDAGIAQLKNCPELESLIVEDTLLTDAALDHFKEMKKLTRLFVSDTRISKGGATALKKALPNCEVIWEGKTIRK